MDNNPPQPNKVYESFFKASKDFQESINKRLEAFEAKQEQWGEDLGKSLKQSQTETIGTVVNGKIDALRQEVKEYNKLQDTRHDELVEGLEEIKEVIKLTTKFFKGSAGVAGWIIKIGGAVGVIWALFKFLVFNAKIR